MFTVREKKILVINDNGTLYATGGICSHYNYSLENGKLFGCFRRSFVTCLEKLTTNPLFMLKSIPVEQSCAAEFAVEEFGHNSRIMR